MHDCDDHWARCDHVYQMAIEGQANAFKVFVVWSTCRRQHHHAACMNQVRAGKFKFNQHCAEMTSYLEIP